MSDGPLSRTRYSEAFWRAHHEPWQRSELTQRQYCEAQGIPLKAFGNRRAKFKAEPQPSERKLLYRRSGLRPYVLPWIRRLALDVTTRVARVSRAEPHTRRASHGGS